MNDRVVSWRGWAEANRSLERPVARGGVTTVVVLEVFGCMVVSAIGEKELLAQGCIPIQVVVADVTHDNRGRGYRDF